MIVAAVTFVLTVAVLILFLSVLLQVWLRFTKRTVEDLIPFLLPIDLDEVERIFDSRQEALLRGNVSDQEFRALQHRRLHLADEYLQRMAHNAMVLAEWAGKELDRRHPLTEPLARELHRGAVTVRAYALTTRLKVNLWMLLRLERTGWLLVSRQADFRECGGIKGLETYQDLRTVAVSLFCCLDQQHLDQFMNSF